MIIECAVIAWKKGPVGSIEFRANEPEIPVEVARILLELTSRFLVCAIWFFARTLRKERLIFATVATWGNNCYKL